MSNKNENIEKLESALGRLKTKESSVYFLTYDSKNNARASVKYIYDLALTLNQNGITSKILVFLEIASDPHENVPVSNLRARNFKLPPLPLTGLTLLGPSLVSAAGLPISNFLFF